MQTDIRVQHVHRLRVISPVCIDDSVLHSDPIIFDHCAESFVVESGFELGCFEASRNMILSFRVTSISREEAEKRASGTRDGNKVEWPPNFFCFPAQSSSHDPGLYPTIECRHNRGRQAGHLTT